MQKLINYLRGSVCLEITGAFPERFLNLCAQAGIGFWALEWPDGTTLRLKIARGDLRRAEQLAEKVMCELAIINRAGAPFFAARFRRRYALLVGLALSLTAVCVLSQFVLTVEVVGNETVSTAAILEELRRQGVHPGVYGPSIDENLVGSAVRLNMKELVWVSVNLHGTRAEVLVRERSPKPEIVDESIPSHVVAVASGIITHMDVFSGSPQFQEGDTVIEGDILISGIVDLQEPEYSQADLGTLTVHADGKVYARTWRTLSASLPLEGQVKVYTGAKTTSWSLTLFGQRFILWGTGGEGGLWERDSSSHTLTLPGGRELPLTLTDSTAREYQLQSVELDRDRGDELLRAQLAERLAEQLEADEGGEVLNTQYSTAVQNGVLTVTLTAECQEQIGKVMPFDGEIGRDRPAPVTPEAADS